MVLTNPVIPDTDFARSPTAALTCSPDLETFSISPAMSSRAFPPFSAAWEISCARSPVSTAACAPAWAPLETSSIPAFASSMALAESCVFRATFPTRVMTSWTEAVLCSEAALMSSARASTLRELSMMFRTASAVPPIMSLTAEATSLISSMEVLTESVFVRSPVSATFRAPAATAWRGFARLREKTITTTTATRSTAAMPM